MQYTLRGVSAAMDRALRALARREGISLNSAVLNALAVGLGLTGQPVRHRALDDLKGTWREDPEFDRAIAEQDEVDESLWR
jgi:hypothetical protein